MSILVTGGAGFIGSHLLDRLAAAGRQAVCLDNFNDFYPPEIKRRNVASALETGLVQLVEGDICDADLCRRVFGEHAVERVVHLAAYAGVRPSLENPLLFEQVNCAGTLNLLRCAREAGVKMFVFGSSSSVYGVSKRIPFREDDPVDCPISPYAASKRAGELYCHVYHHLYGLPAVALRFFTVYGPRQRPDLAITKFAHLMLAGKPIQMFGDGSSSRDYTFVSDIVAGIVAALDSDLAFEIINLGNCHTVALNELVAMLEDVLGVRAQVERAPDQPGDAPITHADISKARRLLGYEPKVAIGEGVRRYVEWLRTQ